MESNIEIHDSFVIGYSKDHEESALVVLRPVDPEHCADYEDVCSYYGRAADSIYRLLCGVDCIRSMEVDKDWRK